MTCLLAFIAAKAASEACPRPNTVQTRLGSCVCGASFHFGNPNEEPGCWTCGDTCHKQAVCQHPGKCVCVEPYVGDGIRCELPMPEILGLEPISGSSTGGTSVTVSFTYPLSVSPPGHCRFGQYYVIGKLLGSGKMECVSPPGPEASVFFSMSLNGSAWTRSHHEFTYIPVAGSLSGTTAGGTRMVWYLGAIAILSVLLIGYGIGRKKPRHVPIFEH